MSCQGKSRSTINRVFVGEVFHCMQCRLTSKKSATNFWSCAYGHQPTIFLPTTLLLDTSNLVVVGTPAILSHENLINAAEQGVQKTMVLVLEVILYDASYFLLNFRVGKRTMQQKQCINILSLNVLHQWELSSIKTCLGIALNKVTGISGNH